jgi:hypothetical protein
MKPNTRNKRLSLPVLALLVLPAVLAVACEGQRGRIMSDSEEDYVGTKDAGAATFDRLIEGAVEKLFQRHKDEFGSTKTVNVAFVDVINKTDRELGPARDDMVQVIETKINHFPGYEPVSGYYVAEALRETRLTAENLFLQKYRDKFLAVLERTDNPAGALLFAVVTNVRTRGHDVTQVNYRLTVELVDAATGKNFKESTQVRKAYNK